MSSSTYAGNESQDLTKTTTLHRREFAPALTKRFRRLKGLILATIGYEYDALRLKQSEVGSVTAAEPARSFNFSSRAEAEEEFMRWLQQAIDEDVVERLDQAQIRDGQHYTARYIRSAYDRGLDDAARRLQEAGYNVDTEQLQQTFQMPIHEEAVRDLYTRTFNELEGITDDMQEEIRETLSEAFVDGWNPKKAASEINQNVDNIGLTRARTLSRTELSNSYNTASAKRYQRMGIRQVRVLTKNPCLLCTAVAADGPYSVQEAVGLIPIHPNCVCTIAPLPLEARASWNPRLVSRHGRLKARLCRHNHVNELDSRQNRTIV
ncbi:hypothetical protein [Halocatena marina]|uniref:hypothetical protein n=1 Tax=Halocatena marina TaxID=2934937 RepID=UPI00200F373B|nr:hypothetical protein [Halocatena marina]